MREVIEIVEDILAQAEKNEINWHLHEIHDFNPEGIAIVYDFNWGLLSDSRTVLLASDYSVGPKLQYFQKTSFLVIGRSKEHILSKIKHETLANPGFILHDIDLEGVENEQLPLFPEEDEEFVSGREIKKRNDYLQEKLDQLKMQIKRGNIIDLTKVISHTKKGEGDRMQTVNFNAHVPSAGISDFVMSINGVSIATKSLIISYLKKSGFLENETVPLILFGVMMGSVLATRVESSGELRILVNAVNEMR